MSDEWALNELMERLTQVSRLSESEARHLVGEVLAFLDEPVEQFARRRHREMQRDGLGNAAIYQRIADEADQRLFRLGSLSERQVRRLIYG
jgi:hypothetical protein